MAGTRNTCPAAAPQTAGLSTFYVQAGNVGHRSLAESALACLPDECHLTTSVGVRSLRSTDSRTCAPRRAHNGYGDHGFAAAGPILRNGLPVHLREPDILFNRLKLY